MPTLDADVRALLQAPNFVHVATLLPDGSPHVVAIWAGLEDGPDGDRIVFFTSPGSRKARNLDLDGRVALSVVDHDNGYRTASVRGRVVERRVDDLATMHRLSHVYTGQPYPNDTNVVYVVEPERWTFQDLPFKHEPGGVVPLDAATRRRLTHGGLTFNAPLGEARAGALVAQAAAIGPATALDLGCGWGELLLRVVEATGARGTGVDEEGDGLERGRDLAAARGLADRVTFVADDCTRWQGAADVVLCVASSHAWGGHRPMLQALAGHVAAGGRAIVGDGYFAEPASDELREWFGDLPSLADLCDAAGEHFAVLRHSTSTLDEWDEFESRWRAGLEASDDPETLALAAERRREYLDGYRGVAGMAWLVLQPR